MTERKQLLSEITPTDNNPRRIKDARFTKLCASIQSFPQMMQARPIIVDEDWKILGGNMRYKALLHLGYKEVPEDWIQRMIGLSAYQKREFIIKDNVQYGEWDEEGLAQWSKEELSDWGQTDWENDATVSDWNPALPATIEAPMSPEEGKKKLTDRFIVPPFSVLDTQQGYWMERKRAWRSLGIKSEEGRKDKKKRTASRSIQGQKSNLLFGSEHVADPEFYSKKTAYEKRLGHVVSSEEFIFSGEYVPNMNEWASGTSIFDPVLCEIMYRWFCPEGGFILDPFAGGSVRGIVAQWLGYHYTGIELRSEQVEANRKQGGELFGDKCFEYPIWICGDSKNVGQLTDNFAFDFVFSCPPYHDLEQYSDNPLDISNMPWEGFLQVYDEIICRSLDQLKDNRFACFIVQEVRYKKGGYYKGLVSETIKSFEKYGAKFFNEIILVNQSVSLPIRVARQFNSGRKVGKKHQNVLVFYKGDPKKMRDSFPDLDFTGIEILESQKPDALKAEDLAAAQT